MMEGASLQTGGEEPLNHLPSLKNGQTAALTKVTKKRNELMRAMMHYDELHQVKTLLDQYDRLFIEYQECHENYYDAIQCEDDKD